MNKAKEEVVVACVSDSQKIELYKDSEEVNEKSAGKRYFDHMGCTIRKRRPDNRRGIICVAIGALLVVSGLGALITFESQDAVAYTPHPPIYINSNADFTPANGVTGGSGTPTDPYVIEGWEINASLAEGIEIRNTNAHFIIRNVYIHSGAPQFNGIFFTHLSNGTVRNVTLLANIRGALVTDSSNVLFYNVSISLSSSNGLSLDHGTNISISNSHIFSNDMVGVFIQDSRRIVLTGNKLHDNGAGVMISLSRGVTLDGNSFVNDGISIAGLDRQQYNSHTILPNNLVNSLPVGYYKNISGLALDGQSFGQLLLANCTNVKLSNLTFSNTDVGIELGYVNHAMLANNNVTGSGVGLALPLSANISVEASVFVNNLNGVFLAFSENISLSYSNFSSNRITGVFLLDTHSVSISESELSFNGWSPPPWSSWIPPLARGNGLVGDYLTDLRVMKSEILGNNQSGIVVYEGQRIMVRQNNITNNGENGTFFFGVDVATIEANIFANNIIGCYLNNSVNVSVYHNDFFSNLGTQAIDDLGVENSWDDGYPSGGNYWSDYTGDDLFSGPGQNMSGSDNIGDIPYTIDQDSEDRYPFIFPFAMRPRPPEITDARLSGGSLEDVTLTWNLSPDDGGALNSVKRYDVYRGTTYDSAGLGYLLIASLPNGTSQFIDNLAGEGDPNNYFYLTCAVALNNLTSCSQKQGGKFTRGLTAGLNLVSIPLIQSDTSITTVLQTISYDKAWTYNSSTRDWNSYSASRPYPRRLDNLSEMEGLWINVTLDSNLTIAGIVPLRTTIRLHTGWNLVGFPSFNPAYDVGRFKSETGARSVEGYDMIIPYHLKAQAEPDILSPGSGYWVYVDIETDWVVTNL